MSEGLARPPEKVAAELALNADVAAWVAAGNRVEQIPFGVSGVPIKMSGKERWRQIAIMIKGRAHPDDGRLRGVASRGRGENIPPAWIAGVVAMARRMDIPVTQFGARYGGGRQAAERRVVIGALRLLGAPVRQIATALGIGESTATTALPQDRSRAAVRRGAGA